MQQKYDIWVDEGMDTQAGALTGPETKRLEELWKKIGEIETEKDGK